MTLLFWLLITCALAIQEAVVYNAHPVRFKGRPDEHAFYTITRFVILCALLYPYQWIDAVYALSFICVFPFVHDGCYYMMREWLEFRQGNRWLFDWRSFTEHSQTTTAKLSFPFWIRLVMAVAGVELYILAHVLQ